MIRDTSINAVLPLVERLNEAGYGLVPIENTPLAALYQASLTPIVDMYEDESGYVEAWQRSLEIVPALGAIGVNEIESDGDTIVQIGTSLYSNSIEEASDLLSGAINNAMNHARNVAGPVIRSLAERLEENMIQSATVNVPFELIDVHLHEVWQHPAIQTILDKFEGKTSRMSRANIPAVACPANIDEIIATGSGAVDKALSDILEEAEMTPAQLFDDLFNSRGDIGTPDAAYQLSRNRMLARFLMANMLSDNPVADSGMNSVQWESCTNEMVRVLGENCKWILGCYNDDAEANLLVMSVDYDTDTMYLNGPVYDKWLDNGGQPEILFGGLIRSRSTGEALSYQGTLEQKEGLLSVWGTYHSAERVRLDNLRTDRIKNALKAAMYSEINDLDPEFYPPHASIENLTSRMLEKVGKLSNATLDDTSMLCIDMVCDTMFFHTPSQYLHTRISQMIEKGIAPDEAAYQTSIEYMVSWVCDSLALVKG